MGYLQVHTALSVPQFLTQNSMTPMPHPLYSSHLTTSDFFFVSPGEKSPQRETFCQCGRDETKMAEALKSTSSKTVLGNRKDISIDVLHQMESTSKVTEILKCKKKYTIFNK